MSSFFTFANHLPTTPKYGETHVFPFEVPESVIQWKQVVRFVENEGWSVGAVTKNRQKPVFAAELDNSFSLSGFGIDGETPQEIHATFVGLPVHSRKPAAPLHETPGLVLVPHHTMAAVIADFDTPEVFSPVLFLPSSRLGFQMADTTGIQYAQGAFEGGCVMWNKQDGKEFWSIFRPEDLAKRFGKSMQALDLPPLPEETFLEALYGIVRSNLEYLPKGNGKIYLRPSVCGLEGGLGIKLPKRVLITFELAAFGDYLPEAITVEGLKNIHRPPSGADKITPNYGGSFIIKKGVKERGYSDYLSFDFDGNVEEVSTCAVGFLKQNEDKSITHIFPHVREDDPDPISADQRNSLDSITRRSVIEMVEKLGHSIEIRDVHADEIPSLDAMFTMGNAVGILQIERLDIKERPSDENPVVCEFGKNKAIQEWIKQLRTYTYEARKGILSHPDLEALNEEWVVREAM